MSVFKIIKKVHNDIFYFVLKMSTPHILSRKRRFANLQRPNKQAGKKLGSSIFIYLIMTESFRFRFRHVSSGRSRLGVISLRSKRPISEIPRGSRIFASFRSHQLPITRPTITIIDHRIIVSL
jgi:hypothetical protein